MNCRDCQEYIELYIDGLLSVSNKEELDAHIALCPACRKDLENALRLKIALADMGNAKPPEGLAQSAIRKAKKRMLPPYAYITAAAAAVIVLVVVFTSGILPPRDLAGQRAEKMLMSAAEDEAADGSYSMDAASEIAEAPMLEMAPEPAAAEEAPAEMYAASESLAPEAGTVTGAGENQEDAVVMEAPAVMLILSVPKDRSVEVRAALESLIAANQIEFIVESTGASEIISFVIPENALEAVTAIAVGLEYGDALTAGQMIGFEFSI